MIVRRYTPPTCTLEVKAHYGRLSRLQGQPILQKFQFKLSFDDPRLPEQDHVTITGDRTELETLHQGVRRYVQNLLNHSILPSSYPVTPLPRAGNGSRQGKSLSSSPFKEIEDSSLSVLVSPPPLSIPEFPHTSELYFKPDGLLYHDLFLGPLANGTTGPFVHLSVLQLFDLVTALQEYEAEAESLPTLKSVEPSTPLWLRTLIMIVVTTGLLTGIIKLVNSYRNPQTEAASQPAEPVQVPLPNLTPLPPPPLQPLPVPPPPTEPKVAANLPPVNTAPLPVPDLLFASPTTPPPPQPLPDGVTQQEGFIIIAEESSSPGTVAPSAPPPLAPSSSPPPLPSSNPVAALPPPVLQLPRLQNAETGMVLEVPPPETNPPNPENTAVEDADNVDLFSKRPPLIATANSGETTLFDEIPQVAEVRQYFQQNWYPPKYLQRTLQYSIKLNSDGSVQSIIPIGQPSINRVQTVKLPTVGEPFVSGIEGGKTAQVRVVLTPDGRVRTFLESLI